MNNTNTALKNRAEKLIKQRLTITVALIISAALLVISLLFAVVSISAGKNRVPEEFVRRSAAIGTDTAITAAINQMASETEFRWLNRTDNMWWPINVCGTNSLDKTIDNGVLVLSVEDENGVSYGEQIIYLGTLEPGASYNMDSGVSLQIGFNAPAAEIKIRIEANINGEKYSSDFAPLTAAGEGDSASDAINVVFKQELPLRLSYSGCVVEVDKVEYDITGDDHIICYIEGTKISGPVKNYGAIRFRLLDEDGNFVFLEEQNIPFIENGERFSTCVSTINTEGGGWNEYIKAGLNPGVEYTLVLETGKWIHR